MSNVSALNGRSAEGRVSIRDEGLQGMISFRGDLAAAKVKSICKALTGMAVPKIRQANVDGETGLCWMSPDELLILLPYEDVTPALDKIATALKGQHYMAENVSDARALIEVEGADMREVLARLFPVDLHPDSFKPGEFRRSRMAQIPAAFWLRDETSAAVICFRSVATYGFDLLENAASGAPVGLFASE